MRAGRYNATALNHNVERSERQKFVTEESRLVCIQTVYKLATRTVQILGRVLAADSE